MGLLEPLKGHKIARVVIHEFACAVLAGEMTEVLLDQAHERIQKQHVRKTSRPSKKTAWSHGFSVASWPMIAS